MDTSKKEKILSNSFDKKKNKVHKKELGLSVPEDYFSNSRKEIKRKVLPVKKGKLFILSKTRMVWFSAASIALLFTVTVFFSNGGLKENDTTLLFDNIDNDIIISSLLVEDDEVNDLVDQYLNEELLFDEQVIN